MLLLERRLNRINRVRPRLAVALLIATVGAGGWIAHAAAGAGRGAPVTHRSQRALAAAERPVDYEHYRRPDPTLPAVPAGAVKRFRVDVLMHTTKVSDGEPPLRVWSFGINGRFMRGTGVSPPIVVEEGDRVEVTFVNGANAAMGVDMPHSLDIHAAEVAPDKAFKTIPAGATWRYRFVARNPGVFMYHCATEPMVLHLGSGMAGMFVVKPRTLPPVDRELWLVQQEYYLGRHPGEDADYGKMTDERPDVIAFNGYADGYVHHPITVRRGERIRIYLLNVGPSHVSSFHVLGAVFDRTRTEGVTGGPAQVLTLPPAAGGTVEFTLRQPGVYPFVDHNFASMSKGAMGALTVLPARRR